MSCACAEHPKRRPFWFWHDVKLGPLDTCHLKCKDGCHCDGWGSEIAMPPLLATGTSPPRRWHGKCYRGNLGGGSIAISLLSFLCRINQSKCCCNYFFTVLLWQNSACWPASPPRARIHRHGGGGLELLGGGGGGLAAREGGIGSEAAGVGAREGSSRVDLAAGGPYSRAVPCPTAGQGLQGSSTGSAGSAERWCPRGCRDAVGESPCLEE